MFVCLSSLATVTMVRSCHQKASNGSIHISMLTLYLLAVRLASYYVFQWIFGLSGSSNLTINKQKTKPCCQVPESHSIRYSYPRTRRQPFRTSQQKQPL